ncbi:hypothetical protein AAC387_Pa07g0508 [Persea americana]
MNSAVPFSLKTQILKEGLEVFQEILQELIGSTQGEIYDYFASLFPKLFMEVYDVMYEYCLLEDVRVDYFDWSILV